MDPIDVFVDDDGYVRVTNRADVDLTLTREAAATLVNDLNTRLDETAPGRHYVKVNLGFTGVNSAPQSWDVQECRCPRPWRHPFLA